MISASGSILSPSVLFYCSRAVWKSKAVPAFFSGALRNIQKLGWTFVPEHAIISFVNAGIVHRLVYQPSKLRRWVRFPLPAPYRRDAGSFRTSVFLYTLASLLASLRILKVKKPLRNPKRKEPGGCLPAASRLDFFSIPDMAKGESSAFAMEIEGVFTPR